MTNIETLQNIFVDVFGDVSSKLGDDFTKDNVDGWDSVHQLNIIALIEDNFDLMVDPEDIIACTSYNSAKEILSKYNVEI